LQRFAKNAEFDAVLPALGNKNAQCGQQERPFQSLLQRRAARLRHLARHPRRSGL